MVASALKWPGGKHYLAKWLWDIAKDVPHIHRVEVYGGSLAFTLASEPEGYSEVVNDLNGDLINFWRVLQDTARFAEFQRKVEAIPFSEEHWESAKSLIDGVCYHPIPGYPGYRAGSDGSIWSCWGRKGNGWRYGTESTLSEEWKPLTPFPTDKGYLRYTLVREDEKRNVAGHILVLEAFVGPRPDGCEGCHNDGNHSNNAVWNVRWDSHSENEKDKKRQKTGVDRAVSFFVLVRQSLAGRTCSFASLSRNRTRRNMNEQASAWLSAIEGLPEVHARVKRLVILNKPAIDVIRSEDTYKTLFYCDPPYVHESRVSTTEFGALEMNRKQHQELLETVRGCRGKVMLSGYRSKLYDMSLRSWNRKEFEVANHASGAAHKGREVECVWTNF